MSKTIAWFLNLLICLSLLHVLVLQIHGCLAIPQQEVVTITFSITGVGVDVSPDTIVLTIDDVDYRVVDLPVSFNWSIGSTHSYQWAEYIPSITGNKRYAWRSTNGIATEMGGVLSVPEVDGVITAEYRVQYLWVIETRGLDST
ncbi:MAG: hypothetical protein QXU13_05030 [Desulfurococcaceae archaeon]